MELELSKGDCLIQGYAKSEAADVVNCFFAPYQGPATQYKWPNMKGIDCFSEVHGQKVQMSPPHHHPALSEITS